MNVVVYSGEYDPKLESGMASGFPILKLGK
jgi:hypothetical protein